MSNRDLSPAALEALQISAAIAAGLSREQAGDAARRAGPDRFRLDLNTLDLRDYTGQTYREWLLSDLAAVAPHIVSTAKPEPEKQNARQSRPPRRTTARQRLSLANNEPQD